MSMNAVIINTTSRAGGVRPLRGASADTSG